MSGDATADCLEVVLHDARRTLERDTARFEDGGLTSRFYILGVFAEIDSERAPSPIPGMPTGLRAGGMATAVTSGMDVKDIELVLEGLRSEVVRIERILGKRG